MVASPSYLVWQALSASAAVAAVAAEAPQLLGWLPLTRLWHPQLALSLVLVVVAGSVAVFDAIGTSIATDSLDPLHLRLPRLLTSPSCYEKVGEGDPLLRLRHIVDDNVNVGAADLANLMKTNVNVTAASKRTGIAER